MGDGAAAGEVVAVFGSDKLGVHLMGYPLPLWLLLSGGVGALEPGWLGKCSPSW